MRGRRSHKTATEKAKQEEFFERAEYVLFTVKPPSSILLSRWSNTHSRKGGLPSKRQRDLRIEFTNLAQPEFDHCSFFDGFPFWKHCMVPYNPSSQHWRQRQILTMTERSTRRKTCPLSLPSIRRRNHDGAFPSFDDPQMRLNYQKKTPSASGFKLFQKSKPWKSSCLSSLRRTSHIPDDQSRFTILEDEEEDDHMPLLMDRLREEEFIFGPWLSWGFFLYICLMFASVSGFLLWRSNCKTISLHSLYQHHCHWR